LCAFASIPHLKTLQVEIGKKGAANVQLSIISSISTSNGAKEGQVFKRISQDSLEADRSGSSSTSLEESFQVGIASTVPKRTGRHAVQKECRGAYFGTRI
jgi:hypothetical protein